jgi:hypothetical protein
VNHKSPWVVNHLGTTPERLAYVVRSKGVRPKRDESGDWLWDEVSIEAARRAIAAIRPQRKRAYPRA